MDDHDYKVEEALTSVQAQLHSVQVRLMQSACKGGMTPEVRRETMALLDWARSQISTVPERI